MAFVPSNWGEGREFAGVPSPSPIVEDQHMTARRVTILHSNDMHGDFLAEPDP